MSREYSKLNKKERFMYDSIKELHDELGYWPTKQQASEKTGKAKSTIRLYIIKFLDAGLIEPLECERRGYRFLK